MHEATRNDPLPLSQMPLPPPPPKKKRNGDFCPVSSSFTYEKWERVWKGVPVPAKQESVGGLLCL